MPPNSLPVPDLGGASPEALSSTAVDEFSDIAISSDDPLRRCAARLLSLIRKRATQSGAASDAQLISVFVLVAHPRVSATRLGQATYLPLFANGTERLTGRIWLTQEALSTGYAIDTGNKPPGDVFSSVQSDEELKSAPTIVFDPRPSPQELRFYPRGLEHEGECITVEIKSETLTAEAVVAVLEDFYRRCLLTPSSTKASPRVWKRATNHRPCEEIGRAHV